MNWISVNERLPHNEDGENSIYCIVFTKHKEIVVRPYNQYHQCWDDEDADDHYSRSVDDKVSHWQPLPEPPKE